MTLEGHRSAIYSATPSAFPEEVLQASWKVLRWRIPETHDGGDLFIRIQLLDSLDLVQMHPAELSILRDGWSLELAPCAVTFHEDFRRENELTPAVEC